MSLDADVIVDRRRMRRKLTFWRVFAVLFAIAAVIGIGAAMSRGGPSALVAPGNYIARVTITGLIRNNQERVEAIERLGKSTARAVIIHVDSPGGTTAGAEQLHGALRKLAGLKPIVVVVDGLAASGGYIAALSADHIISQSTSLVGSIGVLVQYPNLTDLLNKIGVTVESIKSSPLKAAPNGYEPTSPEARAALDSVVKDSYAWFRAMVKERRGLDEAGLDRVADGRIFTGRQGIDLKLVDELGNEATALAWLAKERNIDPNLTVRDWDLKPRFGELSFLHMGFAALLDAVGLGPFARRLEQSGAVQAVDRLNLDGLLALWHPQAGD